MPIDILPSKRQGLYFLEHCRVSQVDEHIVYSKSQKKVVQFFSIPVKNTSVILLGSGTSITQAAVRQLGDSGVMIGFTGGDGSPLFMGSMSEYRPNEYFFSYLKIWQDEEKRLEMAKVFQIYRADFVLQAWKKFGYRFDSLNKISDTFKQKITLANTNQQIMEAEGKFASSLYQLNAQLLGCEFARKPGQKDENDRFNSYLDNGNYLAYGLASVVLWTYGLPFQMAVNHGYTRRGAMVFDVADIIKDGVIMPAAMKAAADGLSRSEMRKLCIENIQNNKTLDYLFETLKHCLS
ncbi:type I-F CRISPR-associated endonuclease Cas1f [Thiomicrorhabdus indica]|uniref:type I-F CRISPR-associated endonuclease Cas1f n=1 Tax=Thiomicrorhabdus indica TaxID=2267253 RepID=UPI00197FE660|nr:type I-F CRISPR-associated endonuclease Cas1f [Thiomicrorhabdus indica]